MIEQKQKLRLDELQVASFITSSISDIKTIKAGDDFTKYRDECTAPPPRTQPACIPGNTQVCTPYCTAKPLECTNQSYCGCGGATSPAMCGGSDFCEC